MAKGVTRRDLNEREILCLQMKSNGYENDQIAAKLELTEHTISCYFDSICNKMGAKNLYQSMADAIRASVIS